MLHEEIFPVSESFSDLVPFVDRLDFEGGDVLNGCDGQGAVLQHELDHFVALAQQSVVQGSVPEAGWYFLSVGMESEVQLPDHIMHQKEISLWDGGCSSGKAKFCAPGLFLFNLREQNKGGAGVRCSVLLTRMVPESCLLAHKLGAVGTQDHFSFLPRAK